jgi:hypothetical protein
VQLPGAENAVVPENKVRNYLLSFSHLEGRSKARFFGDYGFSDSNWLAFASALKNHAIHQEAGLSKQNAYGMFYNVDGPLMTPDGRNPEIRSIWLLEDGSFIPKLITAYPLHS